MSCSHVPAGVGARPPSPWPLVIEYHSATDTKPIATKMSAAPAMWDRRVARSAAALAVSPADTGGSVVPDLVLYPVSWLSLMSLGGEVAWVMWSPPVRVSRVWDRPGRRRGR